MTVHGHYIQAGQWRDKREGQPVRRLALIRVVYQAVSVKRGPVSSPMYTSTWRAPPSPGVNSSVTVQVAVRSLSHTGTLTASPSSVVPQPTIANLVPDRSTPGSAAADSNGRNGRPRVSRGASSSQYPVSTDQFR